MRSILRIMGYPFKIVLLGCIYFYKFCISPILPKSCRFTPTCSTYMVQAINEFGIIKGGFLGVRRIVRCVPWKKGGMDPVPVNIKGEIRWFL